jgi:hypothetical protein
MKLSIVITAALTVLYAMFLSYGPKPLKMVTQSQWQDNQQIMEGYFRSEMNAPVIFVGSSLTRRLVFPDGACAYNLALGGDSALTGLDAVLRSSYLPRVVFVEINVPERRGSSDIVKKSDNFLKRLSPVFYTENMPVNLFYSFLRQRNGASSEEVVSEEVFNNNLKLQIQDYDQDIEQGLLASQMSLFDAKIKAVEKRGIKVVFYELPVAPALEQMPKAIQTRMRFLKEFPDNQLIPYTALAVDMTIHSVDGIHLKEKEATAVAEKLAAYYLATCGKS